MRSDIIMIVEGGAHGHRRSMMTVRGKRGVVWPVPHKRLSSRK